MPLVEPLTSSADLLASVAPSLCVGGWAGARRCDWYHGSWQYLRLVDLVPTPVGHQDFYAAQLHQALRGGRRTRILVSGAADYAMYAQLVAASPDVDALTVSVVDTCPTALYASSWYAHRRRHTIETIECDVRQLPTTRAAAYDLICADAFLTRFDPDSVDEVVRTWAALLRPGGLVVTTVRIDFPYDLRRDHEAARRFGAAAVARWERSVRGMRPTAAEIGDRATDYASQAVSWTLGSAEDVLRMLARRLEISFSDTRAISSGLQPVRYLRVVLRKGMD